MVVDALKERLDFGADFGEEGGLGRVQVWFGDEFEVLGRKLVMK